MSLFAAPVVMAREEGAKGFFKGVGAGCPLTPLTSLLQLCTWLSMVRCHFCKWLFQQKRNHQGIQADLAVVKAFKVDTAQGPLSNRK